MSFIERTVFIEALTDKNATVAQASLCENRDDVLVGVRVTGSSKREQGDVYNQDIALDLAIGRALEKLGRQIRRRGEAQVKAASRLWRGQKQYGLSSISLTRSRERLSR